MVFNENVGPEMCSALSQLLQLQSLEMSGRYRINPAAALHLQLPQLKRLLIEDFGSTTISLECPQLKVLMLFNLFPLHKFSGMPDVIETLQLEDLGIGSVPVEQMLPEQGLKRLTQLNLRSCPGEPNAVREACSINKVRSLMLGHSWATLLLRQPISEDVHCNLKDLALWLPLNEGIPLALEQLTNLTRLGIQHVGAGLMHLTRCLDPFLDMKNLMFLDLRDYEHQQGEFGRWTPAALGLLGLADRRVLQMQNVPGGKMFKLSY